MSLGSDLGFRKYNSPALATFFGSGGGGGEENSVLISLAEDVAPELRTYNITQVSLLYTKTVCLSPRQRFNHRLLKEKKNETSHQMSGMPVQIFKTFHQ